MSNYKKLNKIRDDLENIKSELWGLTIFEKDHEEIKKAMNNLLDELDFVEFKENLSVINTKI